MRVHLARGTLGIFCVIITNIGMSFVLSVFLARLLGAIDYGIYAYVIVWLNLLTIPAAFGLDKLLIRNVAVYQAESAWSLLHGLLRWADRVVLLSSLSLALLATAVIWLSSLHSDMKVLTVFVIGLISLPLNALMLLRQATLQGINRVLIGQLPERLIRPATIIVLVGGVYLYHNKHLDTISAILAVVIASGIAFLSGEWLLRQTFPQAIRKTLPVYQARLWGLSALPIMLTLSMYVVNDQINLILLGIIKGMGAVGIYSVANQAARLINFILIAVNIVLGPVIAHLYANQDKRELQHAITTSIRMVLCVAFPVAFTLMLFGQWFLLIFGREFPQGQMALIVLSVGQLVNCALGPVGLLLIMTGYERDVAIDVGISTVINFFLSAVLIPFEGINGAAIAAASSLIIWNLLLTRRVHERLGIRPNVLPRIKWANEKS